VSCPFCEAGVEHLVLASDHAIALPDAFPISDGHTLVVPRRHVESVFDLRPEEQADLWLLVARVRRKLIADHDPDGFNVGVNDGAAAGQTVSHAHVHVIPRSEGDVRDPRGGVRWVLPERARYWSE
jgi:diadenosine tetraphosphate (Ap4A) HIT family hydrolase